MFSEFFSNLNYKNFKKHIPKFLFKDKIRNLEGKKEL
jgi:hypothetical protein